jgi:hypothetical protein
MHSKRGLIALQILSLYIACVHAQKQVSNCSYRISQLTINTKIILLHRTRSKSAIKSSINIKARLITKSSMIIKAGSIQILFVGWRFPSVCVACTCVVSILLTIFNCQLLVSTNTYLTYYVAVEVCNWNCSHALALISTLEPQTHPIEYIFSMH